MANIWRFNFFFSVYEAQSLGEGKLMLNRNVNIVCEREEHPYEKRQRAGECQQNQMQRI